MLKFSWFRKAALCATLGLGSVTMAGEPSRFHAGLSNADALIQDMEFLTVTLAKQKTIFEEDVKPNIEIFLIGVSAQKPVGISYLFDAESGQRMLMQVPVTNLRDDFVDGNLVPIGIDATKDKKDKTLYKLSGQTYEGWMRCKGNDNYATISKKSEDLPADIATPDVTLNALLTKGHDFVAFSQNSEADAKVRKEAFQKLKENRVAGLKKNTNESQEAFDLRKLIIEQQVDAIGQLFAETALIEMGWTTDSEKRLGHGVSHWTALPSTDFANWVDKLKSEKSVFGSLTPNEKSVFSARATVPISATNLANLKRVYQASPTVLKQQIEKEEGLSAEEKAARIAASEAGIEALTKSLDLGVLDMYLDVSPSTDGKHAFVLGMRSVDNRTSIEKLVEQLGKIRQGWSSKTNIEADGETKFHSFTAAKIPQALLDFYGGDGTVYVAAGPGFVGFATGLGSLDALKKVATTAATGEPKSLEHFVDIQFHARETLKVHSAFMQEKDFDLLQIFKNFGFRKESTESTPARTGERRVATGGGASGKLNALKNFDWHQTAIDAMSEGSDLVSIQLTHVNGALDGDVKMRDGVLTGLGAVIAKFAKENFGK